MSRNIPSYLFHDMMLVPLAPAVGDAAILHHDNLDPLEGDPFPGGKNSHEHTLMRAHSGPADGRFATSLINDYILYPGEEIGKCPVEFNQTLLESFAIRFSSRRAVVNEVRSMETVDGGDIASLPELHPAVDNCLDVLI